MEALPNVVNQPSLLSSAGVASRRKLSPGDVQRILNEKYTSGLSPRRVQYIRAVLRRALNIAMHWGIVHRNVATLVDLPSGKAAKVKPLAAGQLWQDEDYVFTGERRPGRALHPSTVTHLLQQLLADHQLPRQRFHDLRYGCASLRLSQGLSLKDVQDTLGNSQFALTANLYGHLYDERRGEIADRMDALLGTS